MKSSGLCFCQKEFLNPRNWKAESGWRPSTAEGARPRGEWIQQHCEHGFYSQDHNRCARRHLPTVLLCIALHDSQVPRNCPRG
jgi:hypothetical protein